MDAEWISTDEAAAILGVSKRLVQSAMHDPGRRVREWGAEGEGWRFKPLTSRTIYQLRKTAVQRKAGSGDNQKPVQ